jgi:cell division transport system permease protein
MKRAAAALLAYLRGADGADRVVPRGAQSALSIGFLAAVMAFFAVLALAVALAAARLASSWAGELADAATLQVIAPETEIEDQARAALNVLRTTPGVTSVRMVDLAEQEALLEPWLGPDVPVESLPLPLMIEVETDRARLNRASLELRLQAEAPGAIFDDHAAWRQPLIATAERLKLFALGCMALTALALAAVLGLAAHAAVAANGAAIETLRLVGARDGFIARAFTRRFMLRALGGAAVGTGSGMLLLGLLPRASEEGFFLVGIGLVGWHWLLPLLIPPAAAAVAWAATRRATLRTLRRWS